MEADLIREKIRQKIYQLQLLNPGCNPVILVHRKGGLYEDELYGARIVGDSRIEPGKLYIMANLPEGCGK